MYPSVVLWLLFSSYKNSNKSKKCMSPMLPLLYSDTVIRKWKSRRSIQPLPHSETVTRKWKIPPHENSLPTFCFLIFKSKIGFTGGASIAVVTSPKHQLDDPCIVDHKLIVTWRCILTLVVSLFLVHVMTSPVWSQYITCSNTNLLSISPGNRRQWYLRSKVSTMAETHFTELWQNYLVLWQPHRNGTCQLDY